MAGSPRRGAIEFKLHFDEAKTIVGVDEVGRGCLAGPVYAACTVLDYPRLKKLPTKFRSLIRDSKKLSAAQRQTIIPIIHDIAIEAHVGISKVFEIESMGIAKATFLAMHRALAHCSQKYSLLVIDGNQKLPYYTGEQQTFVGGDNSFYAIAAASIIAKEARDSYMHGISEHYPHYGFQDHVGYATKHHLQMISQHGICPLHRHNFSPIIGYEKSPQTEF